MWKIINLSIFRWFLDVCQKKMIIFAIKGEKRKLWKLYSKNISGVCQKQMLIFAICWFSLAVCKGERKLWRGKVISRMPIAGNVFTIYTPNNLQFTRQIFTIYMPNIFVNVFNYFLLHPVKRNESWGKGKDQYCQLLEMYLQNTIFNLNFYNLHDKYICKCV